MPIFNLRLLLTLALLFGCWSKPVDGLDIENCGRALGLESGRILDDQLSASSAFDPLSTGPANARLNSESGSGAWCPAVQINASSHEWVQVELRQPNLITAVRTQGRWDKGRGMEFPSAYMLEYWREELGRWARYKDATGNEIITGNSDTQSPVLRWLDGGFVAKLVRLIPVSESIRTVCLRFELYGCPFKEPLISYSAPIGAVVDSLDLRDLSYDGTTGGQQSNWLQGGLGRMFDGIIGEDTNFVANPRGWLGWHRRQQLGQFVPLEFLFARRQNFSALLLHTSNNRRLGARTFGSARLHFSPFGGEFSPRTFQWNFAEEDEPEKAHWVRIPIPHRVGSRLRVELFFGAEADWLLISEVRFESEDARLAEGIPLEATGSSDNFSTFSYLADDETEAEDNRRQQHQELWPAGGGCLLLVFVCLAVCLSSACLCLCLFALAHRRRRPTPAKGQRRRLCGDSSKSGCGSSSSSSSYSPASLHSKPWLIQQLVHARTGSGKKAAIGTESLLLKSTAGDADRKELMDIARLVMRAEPSGSKAEMGGSGEDADSDQYADPDAPLCMAHNCTPSRQQQPRPGHLHYATRDLLMRRPAGSEFSLGDFLSMNGSSSGGHVSESPSAATESSYRYRATPTLANFPGPPPLWAPPLPPAPPPRRFD